MASEVATALITASGAIVLAGASYWFTKKRERDAELRKEKLEHYKEFVASLSGILAAEGTPEGQRIFARACNKMNLVAPQGVLEALQEFQREIKVSNPDRSTERHDQAISKLFYEVRKDLNISPDDDPPLSRSACGLPEFLPMSLNKAPNASVLSAGFARLLSVGYSRW